MSYEDRITVPIPDGWWEPNGDLADPLNCLYGTLVIAGLDLHLEAWEIRTEDEFQTTVSEDYAGEFELLYGAFSADGHFQTTTINGREYVIFASPFC